MHCRELKSPSDRNYAVLCRAVGSSSNVQTMFFSNFTSDHLSYELASNLVHQIYFRQSELRYSGRLASSDAGHPSK